MQTVLNRIWPGIPKVNHGFLVTWLFVGQFLWPVSPLMGQQNTGRDPLSLVLVKTNIGLYLPHGILAQRFGPGAVVGFDVTKKTEKGWMFSVSGGHMFGGQVLENEILKNIATPSGDIITQAGVFEDYRLRQFGWLLYLRAGKLFDIIGPNPNSGLVVQLGYGLMQHKIWIETPVNNSPQLTTEYKRGYDRLSNGMSFNPFIGYMHLSDNKLINYYIGLDWHVGLTQNRRTINYDSGLRDDRQRFDSMIGLKAGWILPLYKRSEKALLFY
jgi:hypothetical protein